MLSGFCALNETASSLASSAGAEYDGRDEEDVTDKEAEDEGEEQEFLDQDYLESYNKALMAYGSGRLPESEEQFMKLVTSEYFLQCGQGGPRSSPVACKLQYNSLRYLGLIQAHRQRYKQATDCLVQAARIDGSDPVLFYKLATYSVKDGDFHLARAALEESFLRQQGQIEACQEDDGADVRPRRHHIQSDYVPHWPSLELLMSLTFRLGDYHSCLQYVEWALRRRPGHAKAQTLKQRIYNQCPYFPVAKNDPNITSAAVAPDFSHLKLNLVDAGSKIPNVITVEVPKPGGLRELGTALHKQYETLNHPAESSHLTDICNFQVTVQEESDKGPQAEIEVAAEAEEAGITTSLIESSETSSDVVVKGILDAMLTSVFDKVDKDRAYKGEEDVRGTVFTSHEVVGPLVDDLVDSVFQTSTISFARNIVLEIVALSVPESPPGSFVETLIHHRHHQYLSQKRRSFLREVPMELIEKRRSSRVKGSVGISSNVSGGVGAGSLTPVGSNSSLNFGGASLVGASSLSASENNTMSSVKGEEFTAKSLLEGCFPSCLRSSKDQSCLESPDKRISSSLGSTPKKTPQKCDSTVPSHLQEASMTPSPQKRHIATTKGTSVEAINLSLKDREWISDEDDALIASELVGSNSGKRMFLTHLEEFLLTIVEKCGDKLWPTGLCEAYLNCYLDWREHFVLPDEFGFGGEHQPFIAIIITANEILLQKSLEDEENEEDPDDVEITKTAEEPEKGRKRLQMHLRRFVDKDLEHLGFYLLRVKKDLGVRIFSLQLNYFKQNDQVHCATMICNRLKGYIEEHQDLHSVSPVENYVVFTCDKLDEFLKKVEQSSLIDRVFKHYSRREYETVVQILEPNMSRKTKRNATDKNRTVHLNMMIDSLWNLDRYSECISWLEIAIHETYLHIALPLKQQKPSIVQEDSTAEDSPSVTLKHLFNLLKSLECCLCMSDGLDDDFSGIEDSLLPRLADHLLDICMDQIEEKPAVLAERSVLPWILTFKLISYGERLSEATASPSSTSPTSSSTTSTSSPSMFMEELQIVKRCQRLPQRTGALTFLCSAHDYLGQMSLCTMEEGRLLLLTVEKIVTALFKGVENRTLGDQLRKHLDQALFCLYAHPSKKSKLKHLVDHSVPNIALTWTRCLSPYLYLRPEKLPEYDDFKSSSILAETVLFFKRVVALIPDSFRLTERVQAFKKALSDSATQNKSLAASLEDPPQLSTREDRLLLGGVLYLLADYFFKNNEFSVAVEYYRSDLCFNPGRVDSWFPLALSLANILEQKLNETYKEGPLDGSVSRIMEITPQVFNGLVRDSCIVMKCYERCNQLSCNNNTMICIEGANLAYTLSSFFDRQIKLLTESEAGRDPSEPPAATKPLLSNLKVLAPKLLNYALEYYNRALHLFKKREQGDNKDGNESDERWLIHFMRGKIYEKKKEPLEKYLNEYVGSLETLVADGVTLPKKISFNSPPDFALELLEVLYRIHASILKLEFGKEFPLSIGKLNEILDIVLRVESAGVLVLDASILSQNDKTIDEAENAAKAPEKEKSIWDTISAKCVEVLDSIIKCFPQHFKAIHSLGRYHLKTKSSNRDLKKARRLLWGVPGGGPAATRANSMALFGERKSNNFFNGIWRLPTPEIDRAGSFSTHLSKCVQTLIDLAVEMRNYSILAEVALQLRRPPDGERKYLYENRRRHLANVSMRMLKAVLRSVANDLISKKSPPSGTVPSSPQQGSLQETKLVFLFEVYQISYKLRRSPITATDRGVDAASGLAASGKIIIPNNLLADVFKSIVGSGVPSSFEDAQYFCQRVTSSAKRGQDSPQALAVLAKDPTPFLRKEPTVSTTGSSSAGISASAAAAALKALGMSSGSPSSAASAAALAAAQMAALASFAQRSGGAGATLSPVTSPAGSMSTATMDILSAYYSTELAKQFAAAEIQQQALLAALAASYPGWLGGEKGSGLKGASSSPTATRSPPTHSSPSGIPPPVKTKPHQAAAAPMSKAIKMVSTATLGSGGTKVSPVATNSLTTTKSAKVLTAGTTTISKVPSSTGPSPTAIRNPLISGPAPLKRPLPCLPVDHQKSKSKQPCHQAGGPSQKSKTFQPRPIAEALASTGLNLASKVPDKSGSVIGRALPFHQSASLVQNLKKFAKPPSKKSPATGFPGATAGATTPSSVVPNQGTGDIVAEIPNLTKTPSGVTLSRVTFSASSSPITASTSRPGPSPHPGGSRTEAGTPTPQAHLQRPQSGVGIGKGVKRPAPQGDQARALNAPKDKKVRTYMDFDKGQRKGQQPATGRQPQSMTSKALIAPPRSASTAIAAAAAALIEGKPIKPFSLLKNPSPALVTITQMPLGGGKSASPAVNSEAKPAPKPQPVVINLDDDVICID